MPHFSRLHQSRSAEELGADRGGRRRERSPRRVEHVDERALADVETKEIGQESSEALERDALGEAQVDDEGAQVWAKWRAFWHVLRRRRLEFPGAAQAGSTQKGNACHMGSDPRDFDVVIGLTDELRGIQKESAAMLAGAGEYIALRRRIGV